MATIRAFIACDIPEYLLETVSQVQDRLRKSAADVSWTKISGIHITLIFLGEIEEKLLDDLELVIIESSKGQPPFDICIKRGGAFPSLRNPRVLWLGVEDETKGLSSLQHNMEDGLKALGLEAEEREFTPHITLGRVRGSKGRERLSAAFSELRDAEIGSFTIDRVILYKSELKPAGAVYTKLKEVMLQKA